ncbi:DUF222 domain-containing protein [Microlunatus soli]|uniref:DUF222 domain-containing protein n=1 Tax=Microlunatus soli TaxID=630515 RepID=A0A1H1TDC6_9ACTN|nr:DUF222 domain-containing protein [Microlunatus soli]SDS57569.1 protein of unknown function [Microlunatus soli]
MFDQPPEGFAAATAIEQFRAADRTALRAHNQQFVLAAFWPDLHPTDGLPLAGSVDTTFTGERAIRIGGPGTPPVAEFITASLAVETGWSVHKMRYFLADAVDVRYRYPRIFGRVREGQLPRWTAQRISRATRDITVSQAEQVEDILLPKLAGVTGQRLENLITAALITVDAERYEQLAEKARRARYFRISQGNDHGLTDFYGRMDAPDALRLKAMVERIVTILRQHPGDLPGIKDRDAATADEWAAVALGTLAAPIRTAQLLLEHEQPDLFDQAVAPFNPLEPRGWPHPAPKHYPTNDPTAPFDHQAEPPADESEAPADPTADGQQTPGDAVDHDEPEQVPGPVEGHHSETQADSAGTEPALTGPIDHDESAQPGQVPDPVEAQSDNQTAHRRNHHPDDCNAAVRAIIRAIPPEKLLAPITFHVHCAAEDLATDTNGTVRIEELGAATLAMTRRWFGNTATINLKPVIDPARIAPVDAYEIPDRTREAVLVRNPLSRFPNSTGLSQKMDIDHTIAYVPGRRWQTGLHDLGPLVRPEHRYKTFGEIDVRQPEPDLFVWQTGHGRTLIVDATGTHDLGTGPFARLVWTSAATVSSIPLPPADLIT